MHTGFVSYLSLSTQKCCLIIIPSNVFLSVDQRAMWVSLFDFVQWRFPLCSLNDPFLYGGIAQDTGTRGMRRLLSYYIAWSWQFQQGTGELDKHCWLWVPWSGICLLVQADGRCSKDPLLPSAPGNSWWGAFLSSLSISSPNSCCATAATACFFVLPLSWRQRSQLLLKPVNLIPDSIIIPPQRVVLHVTASVSLGKDVMSQPHSSERLSIFLFN